MIEKKIHYVWIGNNKKSDIILNCIASWKKHLPDYEIIEWNNERIKDINNKYMLQAIKYKRFAHASDYIRLYALFNFGGIYLDSDVEITNNLDCFLHLNFFTGYENYKESYSPITAVMGANKENYIIKDLIEEYDDLDFKQGAMLNLETNTTKITKYFYNKFNIKGPFNGLETNKLDELSVIFPYYYFCTPKKQMINYSIHHFNGSWVPSYYRKDKMFFLKKFILSRFEKLKDGELPIEYDEVLIFKIKTSKNKTYALIKKK